jgi:uncharacterized protein (TIGR03437 family)
MSSCRGFAVALFGATMCFAQANLTPAQWQEDLAYLSSQLQSRHPNLFFRTSQQTFQNAVADLNARIPQLNEQQILAGLMRVAALPGDAHTAVRPNVRGLPITLRWFTDGLFVTQAAEEYRRALGAKVVGIGVMTAEQAHEAMVPVMAHENEAWLRDMSAVYLGIADLLLGVGVTTARTPVRYTLQDRSGTQFTIDVSSSTAPLIQAPDPSTGYTPPWLRRRNENYWWEYLPTSRLIYIAYNQCAETPGLSFQAFLAQIGESPEAQQAEGAILDLRNNFGGNSEVIRPLFQMLTQYAGAAHAITALIGRRTFSSAVLNAIQLADVYGVRLVGEAAGNSPNHFGNPAAFTLPNSGVTVNCSTIRFNYRPGDDRDSLMPDVEVSVSSADYFARHDPVLLAAIEQPFTYRRPSGGGALPATVNSASFGAPVSPGALVSVFGNFAGVAPSTATALPLPATLGGVEVKVNGVAAPLVSVGPGQINFQAPSATAAGTAQVSIAAGGQEISSGTVEVTGASPGIYLRDFTSLDRPGAIMRQDGRLTDSTTRARRNEVIVIYGTGASALSAPVADGAGAPFSPLAETIRKPRVFVGAEEAQVVFSGLTPGLAGLWQINAHVPDAASIAGQMPVVVLAAGGFASNAVTMWFE